MLFHVVKSCSCGIVHSNITDACTPSYFHNFKCIPSLENVYCVLYFISRWSAKCMFTIIRLILSRFSCITKDPNSLNLTFSVPEVVMPKSSFKILSVRWTPDSTNMSVTIRKISLSYLLYHVLDYTCSYYGHAAEWSRPAWEANIRPNMYGRTIPGQGSWLSL